ncbi:nesprin-1-like isoform x11 protein, partial [Lasius niger]
MEDWKQRSKTLLDQIYAVDPYYVSSNEYRFIGQASYADIAAGRTSPSSRNCSPYRQQRDVTPSTTATQVLQSALTRVQKSTVECLPLNEAQVPKTQIQESDLDKPKTQAQTKMQVQCVQTVDDQAIIGVEENQQDIPEVLVESPVTHRGRSPTRKMNSSNAKDPKAMMIQQEEPDRYDNRRFSVTPRQETRAESTRSTLVLHQEQKGRSPSPMWVPGSASYADILRGCIQTTQINIAFAEPSRQEMVPLSGESPRGRTQSPCTEQVPASFTMNVDESQEITEASQVASMQETQVEDMQIAEAYCQSPEISAVKVEEQSYAESGPSNWADKHLEGMLQHVKPYENLPRQSVTETVQSTEIYDYMVPEPMPKLIGFIGSQLGTYPMSSYVYASSGHQQVQQLDTTNLNPYNNSSLTYTPEHYVVPTAYLSASDIYQQTPIQQQCPVNDTRHEIPMLVEKPVEVPVARQEVSKDAIITESIDESKQKEPVNVSETSIITKTEGRDALPLNDIETKGQIFSYAQILSQGLSPRITSTHVINKQDVINQSPTADQQNKEQSSLTFRELSPLQEPKYEQDSYSIPKSKQFRQSKKNDWDMIKKREVKKRQSNDKTEQIDEKKSRKLVDKPMEKQNKEKLSPPKQLEIRDESNIISDSSENKKREEKPEQQEKQIDCKDMNLSQEKKRKQKKKKADKSVGDEIDKALKEIEDMDKQKVKSQREKLKEQIEEQNKSQNSANETLGKSKDEANKKQGKFGETSIKSGKSKKVTKIKENVLLEQAALQSQINARDQCILKDNAENKEDTKNVKVLNSKGEEKVQKNISNNMLKDQSQIDNDIHINSDKPDIKTKHKNKTDKNITKDKEQSEKSSENKVQGQSDILSDKRIDKINIVDESSITEITKLPVAGKIELEKEKSNIVEIESTKGQKDASKKEKNKTKSKKSKLNAESNNKNQEKLGNDKEITNDKYLESVEPVIDTEMKNSKSKALDTAEIVNKVNSNAKDKTNPKKKDKTSKSKMKSEVAIDHTLSVIPTSKVLDETKINLNDTEIKESSNQEINVPKSEQIIEAKIAETAVISNFKEIQSEEIVLPPNTVPQAQDIKQTDITCKNDTIYYDRHEAKELTETKELEHYQANTKLGAENLIKESSETADMMDEKKAIDSHIEIIEKTEKRETEKHQMKTGKSKKLQKAKFNAQDKNKIRKDNIKTPQLVESENKSVGKEDELNTESLSKPLSASTIENFVPDQYIEKTNETEHALVPDNSCLVQSKTDTENNLSLKIDERENATLGQINKHVPSLSKSKKKDKSKGKTVKPVILIKEDIHNEPMEFIKDADKPEAVSTLSTKVTIPKKELTVSTPSENLTEIVSATETIPVISESSPEVDNMNVKEKDQIVEKEKFDDHKQKPIIEEHKDIKTDVIEDFPINDEKDVTSEDVTSKKIISKCTKKKKTLFPKHITEQTKHSSSFYDKFQEKIVFKDNLIKEKEISEPVICPKQRLGKNPPSPTKINNIETEEAQETKKQLLKNAEPEAEFDSEISSDSVGEAKIHEKHKENIHNNNLESEQLPSIGKALIIEKTVTTVTTTSTSIPGSIKVDKPADIKSIKSVEILENIPLPKIVGSKVTELITLRPETVEASLTTTYARVGNDFPVCSPTQSDQATNSQKIGLISASSTENIMTSDESAPFDNMRNRRGISPGISGKFNDTPTAIIALEDKKRELVAHSDDNMERQEESILLNEFTIKQEDPCQSNIKVSEGEPETDNTKEEETFSVDIISQNDNIIKNQDINNSVETDNITEIDKIDQVVSYIPNIKKEELEENKVEENKVNVEIITQNVQEEAADEQTEIETKCGNNPTISKIKSENIPENVKTKKQIVPNYLLDVIKPYAMDRHAYNNAESNFYRNFKIIKIVKELQPPAAVIQTKSESIEEIIQGSVMKPKSTNREMSEINSRRHALIMETPKYPIISFYEIESQWIKNKSISEKSMSISTDNSDSRNSAVEEKIEQTIEEKMTIDAVSAEEILQQETLVNSTANNISLTDITEDLNSSRDLNSSDSISQAISKVTELNASIASPVEKINDNQLVDTGAITDTNIQIEEAVAKNDIKTEQELLEIKTAPIVKSSINLESDDAWIALLEEEIILDDDFDDPETQTVTYVDDQIEKREEEIEKKKLIIETDIEKIEKEAEIEKPEEEIEKKEIIEKQEEKIEKRETMIEEREENIEREKAKIETLDNATLMEIAVKDEYHAGIKDIQNDILYVDSKNQSDKMKNQPKKKKESKHIKDTKAKVSIFAFSL